MQLKSLVLDRPYSHFSPFDGSDFVVWLIATDPTLTRDEQNALADQLVQSGCRYAVCSGLDCSSWDDAVDWAYIATGQGSDPPKDRFVMTTWHEDDTLEEIAEYFARCTRFDGFEPERFLVLGIGSGSDASVAAAAALSRLTFDSIAKEAISRAPPSVFGGADRRFEFEIEQVLMIRERAYVFARQLAPGCWTLSDSSLLGGEPIHLWTQIPRAIDTEGHSRLDLFAFCLRNIAAVVRFAAGQRIELNP